MEVCVKTLVEAGRQYQWQRPEHCPKCQSVRVWGHGYVEAYFDEAGGACVFLKRYRCPECGVVIRVRPSGYWRRIQATIATVGRCVMDRLEKGRWRHRDAMRRVGVSGCAGLSVRCARIWG